MANERYKVFVEGELEIVYASTLEEAETLALALARKYPRIPVLVSDTYSVN